MSLVLVRPKRTTWNIVAVAVFWYYLMIGDGEETMAIKKMYRLRNRYLLKKIHYPVLMITGALDVPLILFLVVQIVNIAQHQILRYRCHYHYHSQD